METLEFCIYSFMSSAYSDNFIFPSDLDTFFISCLIAVARTSNTVLNKSGESGHPVLFQILARRLY